MNHIEIRSLSKSFRNVNALDGLNIKISKGSLFGVLGPNGAGKTTLLKILATLINPDDGEIYLDGNKLITADNFETGSLKKGSMSRSGYNTKSLSCALG